MKNKIDPIEHDILLPTIGQLYMKINELIAAHNESISETPDQNLEDLFNKAYRHSRYGLNEPLPDETISETPKRPTILNDFFLVKITRDETGKITHLDDKPIKCPEELECLNSNNAITIAINGNYITGPFSCDCCACERKKV